MSLLTSDQVFGGGLPAAPEHEKRTPLGKHHRAPKGGYDTPVKEAWRVSLWEQMVRHLSPGFREDAKVFLIDTTEALELQRVLQLGFQEGNIHVCNVNPAVVAVLKRRYPGITTYGVEADAALRRAWEAGVRFDCISLDLCGPISKRTHDVLHAARTVINGAGSVGLTLMRGREPSDLSFEIPGSREDRARWSRAIRHTFKVRAHYDACVKGPLDVMRIGVPLFHLAFGDCHWGADGRGRTTLYPEAPAEDHMASAAVRGGGIYSSGQVTMLWLCFALVQPIKFRPVGWTSRTTDGWRSRGGFLSPALPARGVKVSAGFQAPLRT